jgi:hypothetical protein
MPGVGSTETVAGVTGGLAAVLDAGSVELGAGSAATALAVSSAEGATVELGGAGRPDVGAPVGRAGGGANSGASATDLGAERERTYQVTAPTSSASRNQRRRRRGGLSFAMTRG